MTDPLAPAPPPAPSPAPTSAPSGLVYADVPNRAVAYIIDAIIVGIISAIVGAILGGIGLRTVTLNTDLSISVNYVAVLVNAIIGVAISAAYFIYTWTNMRATVGMRLLGMQIGNAGDGATLTQDQAIRRYLALAAPGILAQVAYVIPLLGFIVALAALAWFIYLIYTTANSPTKQGWHDVYAHTQVVKAARSA
jgi:uncharacterized RDD family membrane protein YckC